MKKQLFLLLLFLFLSNVAFADNVPEDRARQVATSFWQSSSVNRGISPALKIVKPDGVIAAQSLQNPAYYIFKNTSGPGFVIVAGDDVAMPVLGYSFENDFPEGVLPANLESWLETISEEVNLARSSGLQAEAAVTKAWAGTKSSTPVVEMETAKWDQSEPYNLLCPTVNGVAPYTGCTATALAIIMRYHQWPVSGTGTLPGYVTATNSVTVSDLTLGHEYDWSNMPLDYSSYTDTEAAAVATLMRDCAILMTSDFCPVGSAGTGANVVDIFPELNTYMGYDKSIRNVSRSSYSTAEWNTLMQDELNNKRPVMYYGTNSYQSHACVMDGYTDDGYYHINWGWSGSGNGYYLLTSLNSSTNDAEAYSINQGAIIGIQKDAGGSYVDELRFYEATRDGKTYNGLSVDETVVTGNYFTMYAGGLTNLGSLAFNGDVKVAVTDSDGNIVEDLRSNPTELPVGSYIVRTYSDLVVNSTILPGYRIRCFYRSENSSAWSLIYGNDDCTWELLIAAEYSIEETTEVTFNKTDRLLTIEVHDGVSVSLQTSGGSDLTSSCNTQGNVVTIDTSLLNEGTYTIILQNEFETKKLNISL